MRIPFFAFTCVDGTGSMSTWLNTQDTGADAREEQE